MRIVGIYPCYKPNFEVGSSQCTYGTVLSDQEDHGLCSNIVVAKGGRGGKVLKVVGLLERTNLVLVNILQVVDNSVKLAHIFWVLERGDFKVGAAGHRVGDGVDIG